MKMKMRSIFNQILFESLQDTKVSDNGKPILMYHGGGYSGGDAFRGDGWFTVSKTDGKYYARQSGGSLTAAYLDIKNPLYAGYVKSFKVVPDNKFLKSLKSRKIEHSVQLEDGYISYIEPNSAVLIAKDIGRDGVIVLEEDGSISDSVIFNSSQVVLKK